MLILPHILDPEIYRFSQFSTQVLNWRTVFLPARSVVSCGLRLITSNYSSSSSVKEQSKQGEFLRGFKKGFAFIELLLVIAIILFLFYKVINLYFKNTPAINKETGKVLSEQDINTTDYKSIIDTTKDKIKNIQTQHFKELESIK
jgi:competence protein ComGC